MASNRRNGRSESRFAVRTGLLVLWVFLLGMVPAAWAQASLAAENIIDDVSVNIGGQKEVFTLFRDARNASQWYYVPNRPRLIVRDSAGGPQPEFTLLRYQFPDPANAAKLVEEGILQFAAALAAPAEAIDAFREAIQKRTGSNDVRISAIPFKAADVALYSYAAPGQKSTLLSAAPYGSGIAPLFASQSMVFSLPLTKIGSDVMETLVTGATGVPVVVTFTFNALTPPAGFKVTVDYDQLFQHYSRDEKFRATASYFGLFGASYESSVQTIRESLINNKDIKVEVIAGENFTLNDIDKYLQPILARINADLLEAMKPPPQIDPASAAAPSAGGWFGSAGYSVAIKDVEKRKKGTEVWDMRVQQIVERKTNAQGFIGIGQFPEPVRKQLVTLVPRSQFTSAYLMLPSPAVAQDLGITSLDLQVSLRNAQSVLESQVVKWKPGTPQWKDIGDTDRTVLAYALSDATRADPTLKSVAFDAKLQVTTPDQSMEIVSSLPVANGQAAMPGVNNALFRVVEIDGSLLPFAMAGGRGGDILVGNVEVKVGSETFKRVLRTRTVNGQSLPPDPIRILVKPVEGQVASATIVFQLRGGRTARWEHSGKDLAAALGGWTVMLDESQIVR